MIASDRNASSSRREREQGTNVSTAAFGSQLAMKSCSRRCRRYRAAVPADLAECLRQDVRAGRAERADRASVPVPGERHEICHAAPPAMGVDPTGRWITPAAGPGPANAATAAPLRAARPVARDHDLRGRGLAGNACWIRPGRRPSAARPGSRRPRVAQPQAQRGRRQRRAWPAAARPRPSGGATTRRTRAAHSRDGRAAAAPPAEERHPAPVDPVPAGRAARVAR